jgi:hypothetical protein
MTDNTQRNSSNVRFANYMLSSFNNESVSDSYVNFATQQPSVMFSGIAHGSGLNRNVIDVDSLLLLKKDNERPLEKLQLFQRPFATVPYLGRGSCNPTIESQLQQGEIVSDKKSVSNTSEKSFSEYVLYSSDSKLSERVKDTRYTVEESALDGWVRGGIASRELSNDELVKQSHRPLDKSY